MPRFGEIVQPDMNVDKKKWSLMGADLDNLPDPDVLANEIIETIEAGLASFRVIMETINGETESPAKHLTR